jgi:tetratricopeptide (TPR) repeat protein
MEANTSNLYLFKALEAYPYELAKALESLNYALSYDPENVRALCLMAKLQDEQLGEYEAARSYYERALASRLDIPNVYPDFIRLLVNYDDFDEAQKLIEFARTVKGIDRAGIELAQAHLYEATARYTESLDSLKEAKQFAMNGEFIFYVDEVISRVKKKREVEHNRARKVEETPKEPARESSIPKWLSDRLNNLL